MAAVCQYFVFKSFCVKNTIVNKKIRQIIFVKIEKDFVLLF